jgi:hypothetical protein
MVTNVVRCLMVVALVCATPAWAQEPAPRPVDRTELRHQIYVMEGALSRAVQFGALQLNRELPMLRQSMMWSLRMMLQQDNASTKNAIAELRRHVQSETDPAERRSLEAAIARLEAQASPFGVVSGGPGANPSNGPGVVPARGGDPSAGGLAPDTIGAGRPAAAPPSPTDTPWLTDTNRVYTEAVQRAIIDAMIDFSAPMNLGNDEWLTVAARDNERRDSLAPQDPYEEVVTVLLRIKGADLREYRAGKIDKAEARKRVKVGEF